MKVREIAKLLNGELVGNAELDVNKIAKIEDAGPGCVAFLANPKYIKYLATTQASCLIVSRDQTLEGMMRPEIAFVIVADARVAFGWMMQHLNPLPEFFKQSTAVHPMAVVDPTATLGIGVSIGAYCVISANVRIGDATVVMPGVKIATGTKLGARCVVYPNVVILNDCTIGDRVILQSGCVIGTDGFGFSRNADGSYNKLPHGGTVVIEDDVEIGSNSTIARSALGATRIEKGCKLDCHVHIAHHCNIGENTVFAAQVGVSGSTQIGKRCQFGGQSGVAGHVVVADDMIIGAHAGVMKSFVEPHTTVSGFPARNHVAALRGQANMMKAAAQFHEIKQLRAELETLKKQISEKFSPRK
ncbi:MAG: UDP-3-O-(3-hydroxymyristoyl)glucosamine N-acyltransferase [Planctomycetes bacterium]|nr:UDP-3-O-(3-hydroxymyristoyl)glucosamine N-acyltransferase [Planctomycetota bacterium]